MKGVVLKPFPFAFDGINITQLKADDEFPPLGYAVSDGAFNGLADAGFIKATISATSKDDIALNKRIIDSIDKRLAAMSDEELKALIARRGTQFSGNLVHAVLVREAKVQLVAEYEGTEPVLAVDPPATPPSAQQSEAPQDGPQSSEPDQNAAGQQPTPTSSSDTGQPAPTDGNSKTDQFGDAADFSKSDDLSEAELNTMNKGDLEAYAVKKGIDLSQAKTKAEYIDALKPKVAIASA